MYQVKLKPWESESKSDYCTEACPGDNVCCCENKRDYGVHKLHICSNPNCICHSKGRYIKPKKLPDKKWITVGKVGMLKFVFYTGEVGFIPLKPKFLTREQEQDLQRARGLAKIPDSVAPGYFGDEALDIESEALERQTDLETFDNLIDLMEQSSEEQEQE